VGSRRPDLKATRAAARLFKTFNQRHSLVLSLGERICFLDSSSNSRSPDSATDVSRSNLRSQ